MVTAGVKAETMQAVSWLALVAGNSRLHWALFRQNHLQRVWHTPHFSADQVSQLIHSQFNFQQLSLDRVRSELPALNLAQPLLQIASVVPEQQQLWATYPSKQVIGLEQVPLNGMYPGFGLDRALALWGAITKVGAPVLVIDGGTALTLTAADADYRLMGGAILPGLGLQLRSLNHSTAALPEVRLPEPGTTSTIALPARWARNTSEAIASGILHSLTAGLRDFLEDWWQRFPGSPVVLTGGDSDRLYHYLNLRFPEVESHLQRDPVLIFRGIQSLSRE